MHEKNISPNAFITPLTPYSPHLHSIAKAPSNLQVVISDSVVKPRLIHAVQISLFILRYSTGSHVGSSLRTTPPVQNFNALSLVP